jgi:hypothetical protein
MMLNFDENTATLASRHGRPSFLTGNTLSGPH